MQIDTNIATQANGVTVKSPPQVQASVPVTVPVAKLDSTSFHESMDLEKDLQQSEDARAEKVERALNLIGQVQYPPATVIRRIATLLGGHMASASRSEAQP